ncbi:MAG: helix-turn-helix domain-containing protein [Lachnospiraceae bacterium]|nr:helix-turn-helix domain-containing protein [Lachnospiraceae bacterium]
MDQKQTCLYYTAKEVMDILGVSRAKAYKVVKELNEELAARGYIVTAGKVPKKLLAERLYGMTI